MPLSLSLADSIYQTVWLCVSSYVELRFTVTTNRCCVWCWTTAVGPMMSFVAKSWSPFESTDWVGEGYLWNCAVYAVELYEHSLVAIVHLYLTYTTNAHPPSFKTVSITQKNTAITGWKEPGRSVKSKLMWTPLQSWIKIRSMGVSRDVSCKWHSM